MRKTVNLKTLRPELGLIIDCTRNLVDNRWTESIKSRLQPDLDWGYLFDGSYYHGVLPIVYREIFEHGGNIVPELFLSKMRQWFFRHSAQNMRIARELVFLVNIFKQNGILAVPFKGPFLAETCYGHMGYRQSMDLDILICKKDQENVKRIMLSNGYYVKIPSNDVESFEHLNPHHISYQRNGSGIPVEMHTDVFKKNRYEGVFSLAEKQDNLRQVEFFNTRLLDLLPEDLLLVLSVHGSQHRWDRMIWISDIAMMVARNPVLDWTRLLSEARKKGLLRMTLLGLDLAHEVFYIFLPDGVQQLVKADKTIGALKNQVMRNLFLRDVYRENDNPLRTDPPRFYYQVRVMEKWSDKFKVMMYMLGHKVRPNIRDKQSIPLPRPFVFFIRPFRLAFKYIPDLMRRRRK
ncbi:nucleotidyltransferase family protein [candidate division KSB1 bacterium]|nr:nucleotidyltransferase family protein [candidate division KSB1 bacterium]